jgi:hypothetical protein
LPEIGLWNQTVTAIEESRFLGKARTPEGAPPAADVWAARMCLQSSQLVYARPCQDAKMEILVE